MNHADKDWFGWAAAHIRDWRADEARWQEEISDEARNVLDWARQAAATLGHDSVGAEHLLAGLLKLDRGPAAEALKGAGLGLPALRAEIEADRGPGAQDRSDLTWTPRARGILQRSLDSARTKNLPVQPEDILIEMMKEEAGLPAQVFRKQGIDPSAFRNRLEADRHRGKKMSHPSPPPEKGT